MRDGLDLIARIAAVRGRIAAAAARAGRDPGAVRLVAVTKDVPAERVREAIAAGVSDVGENRVQELEHKIAELGDVAGAARWHFIGTLQRNKARRVAGAVALIHSLDGIELAAAVGRAAAERGAVQDVLLQVNVGAEPTKHGLDPGAVADVLRRAGGEPGLRVGGLMTIAPQGDPAAARACFIALRSLRDGLRSRLREAAGLHELSMGMTDDFEPAVEEGATIVRVGRAIFGDRRR